MILLSPASMAVAALSLPPLARSSLPDTNAVRAAFTAAEALEADYEKKYGHVVVVNGIRVHYLDWGKKDGVPLVWAHGSMGTAYELRALAPRLVAAGYRLIAPCLRGQGKTQVTDYHFTVFHNADDLIALMDRLGIRSAVFGGSSKGGFVAAAVYDQYPTRVRGLLLHDGGSWSNQIMFDRHGTKRLEKTIAQNQGPPAIEGETRFDVFKALVGERVSDASQLPPERALELIANINPRPNGKWVFMAGFRDMMGTYEGYLASATAPSTLPPLQRSQHLFNPLAVFRKLDVPLLIIDPQDADTADDELPVTDQNLELKALHPELVVHKIYPATQHAAYQQRPDWVIRDAIELLGSVNRSRARPTRKGDP
jgi:pimeloyl-ACP methyl ester carboxylesterase